MKDRGYINGTVCPVIPTPVGTGVLIAGGNFNLTDNNRIYNNWRYGTMQFWVPAPLRDEFDPGKLFDTSHGNQTKNNIMGIKPDGKIAHNGMDHWWDDQGNGNCWENNKSSRGKATNNFVIDPGSCAGGGSKLLPGLVVKDAGFLTCSQYNRADPLWRTRRCATGSTIPSSPTDARTEGPLVGVLSSTRRFVAGGRRARWSWPCGGRYAAHRSASSRAELTLPSRKVIAAVVVAGVLVLGASPGVRGLVAFADCRRPDQRQGD